MLLLRSPLEDDAGHKGFQQRTFFGSENVSGCGCTTKTANASSSALLHCTDQVIQKTQQLAITQRVLGFFLSTSIQAHSLPWQNEEMEAEKLKGCYQIQVCNTKVYFLSESKEFASFRSYNHLSFYSHSPAFSFSFCFLSVSFFLYFHRL